MKVEVEANEIRDGKIEKISLVTNGAIRSPFKILKMEEIKDATKTGGLKDRLSKIFGATDEQSRIAALFVRKDVARKWLPLIRKHGFRVEKEHADLIDGVVVLKQEGFDEKVEGSIIAINPDVAIQLDHVSKAFDPFPMSASFEENVKAGGFFPGLHNAMDSLGETVLNVLNSSDQSVWCARQQSCHRAANRCFQNGARKFDQGV